MEIWKSIPSSPRYEVSNLGRVRRGQKILHTRNHTNGYRLTTLGTDRPSVYIHSIVAEAFIGPRPTGSDIDHLDFDKTNNRPENLEYVTHQENQLRAIRAGRIKPPTARARGELHGSAKLSEDAIKSIRFLASDEIKMKKTAIARLYGIHVRHVFKILAGKQWAHV